MTSLQRLHRFGVEEDGATMVEYALMLLLVALVCVASVTLVGGQTLVLLADGTLLAAL